LQQELKNIEFNHPQFDKCCKKETQSNRSNRYQNNKTIEPFQNWPLRKKNPFCYFFCYFVELSVSLIQRVHRFTQNLRWIILWTVFSSHRSVLQPWPKMTKQKNCRNKLPKFVIDIKTTKKSNKIIQNFSVLKEKISFLIAIILPRRFQKHQIHGSPQSFFLHIWITMVQKMSNKKIQWNEKFEKLKTKEFLKISKDS
jgi:hypothetical protein